LLTEEEFINRVKSGSILVAHSQLLLSKLEKKSDLCFKVQKVHSGFIGLHNYFIASLPTTTTKAAVKN
jgi:hypothetical protein